MESRMGAQEENIQRVRSSWVPSFYRFFLSFALRLVSVWLLVPESPLPWRLAPFSDVGISPSFYSSTDNSPWTRRWISVAFCSLLMTPNRFWTMATDALPPQDATALAEDLGIEFDTDEHIAVEHGPLCALPNLKRKRV